MGELVSTLIKDTKKFVEAHLGKGCFAPHTGQDWPAWCSFVYAMQCWTHGGGDDAIDAMRANVRCAQPMVKILQTFVQAIPAIGDWRHVSMLWPTITREQADLLPPDSSLVQYRGMRVLGEPPDFDARELCALEICWNYDEKTNKRTTVHSQTLHGWRKP